METKPDKITNTSPLAITAPLICFKINSLTSLNLQLLRLQQHFLNPSLVTPLPLLKSTSNLQYIRSNLSELSITYQLKPILNHLTKLLIESNQMLMSTKETLAIQVVSV